MPAPSTSDKTIAIIGGGTAATQLASVLEASLKKQAGYKIVLITGKEYFFHLIGGLRANVKESDLGEMICVPYDKLFKDTNISRVVTKQVREVKSDRVVLEDGEEIAFTYAVVATGKQWVTPVDVPQARQAAIEQMKAYRSRVKSAKHILVVGGGAVGVEIAGEIAATYPKSDGKKVTLIHRNKALMNDTYNTKFRSGLQKQLLDLGVNLHLGDALEGNYDFEQTGGQTITTKGGERIENVDLVIQATGGKVNTDLLQSLVPQLLSSNGVKVKPTFQLEGHDNIFAMGDVADLPEQKQAAKVPGHVSIVHANLLASINGTVFQNYKQPGEMIVVNIADKGGMGYLTVPLFGTVTMDGWFARMVKGKGLFVAQTRASLGY